METKTTLYNHMKDQIDETREENIRLSQRLQVKHRYCLFLIE
jgi:hypothetical protein